MNRDISSITLHQSASPLQGPPCTGRLSHECAFSVCTKYSFLSISTFYVGMRTICWCVLVYSVKCVHTGLKTDGEKTQYYHNCTGLKQIT